MNLIEELVKGKSGNAIYLTVIGDNFRNQFEKIALTYYVDYCKKYDIGLLILNNYVDNNAQKVAPYNLDPGYQRLLIPSLIKRMYGEYWMLADMDADCIPGPLARNIFSEITLARTGKKVVYLIYPTPKDVTRSHLGKRISLLRKTFHDDEFPLDSLLAGDDEFEKRVLGFDFEGPIACMGTCLGHIDLMDQCGTLAYESISSNFSGYLQNYRNKIFREIADIKWLPYEYQAIWNYEQALYYPFLYSNSNPELAYECVQSTLMRVDMLHFAGAWPENDVFFQGPFDKNNSMTPYFEKLPSYLAEQAVLSAYGRLKFKASRN
jgi:hypothetical protein